MYLHTHKFKIMVVCSEWMETCAGGDVYGYTHTHTHTHIYLDQNSLSVLYIFLSVIYIYYGKKRNVVKSLSIIQLQ